MTRKVRPLFRSRSVKLGELNGYVEEVISGQKTAKAYHREAYFLKHFDAKNDEAVDAYYRADYYGSMTGPSVNFINNLSLAFVSASPSLPYPKRPYRRIRLDAMADAELLRRNKARLKFSRKVSAALVEEAVDSLAQAKAMHDELEGLYNPHVDFDRVYQTAQAITDELTARL